MRRIKNKLYLYTNLSTEAIFDLVFDFTENSVNQSDSTKSTKKEIFVIILMRLTLGLFQQDLTQRFAIRQLSISRILHKWSAIFATWLSSLITWPKRKELQTTLAACFSNSFPKYTVIIDCYWFGITPRGTISYLS